MYDLPSSKLGKGSTAEYLSQFINTKVRRSTILIIIYKGRTRSRTPNVSYFITNGHKHRSRRFIIFYKRKPWAQEARHQPYPILKSSGHKQQGTTLILVYQEPGHNKQSTTLVIWYQQEAGHHVCQSSSNTGHKKQSTKFIRSCETSWAGEAKHKQQDIVYLWRLVVVCCICLCLLWVTRSGWGVTRIGGDSKS